MTTRRTIFISVLIMAWIGFTLYGFTVLLSQPAHGASADITCVAHRGAPMISGHTEETTAAYTATLDAGVMTVEGDVHFTSTGYPVMLHDATLGQFGRPDLAVANLTQTQATSYTSSTGDHMMTLWQLGTEIQDHPGSEAEIELKQNPTPAEWPVLETRLDHIGRDRLTVTSFSITTIRAVQDHGYRTALNSEDDVSTTAAPVVSQNMATVDASAVQWLASAGVRTEAWTPDTTTDLDAMAAAGATIMLTNDPLACMAWAANR